MYDLKQSLLTCGYRGPCENLELLRWAVRTGASSQFFLDLILWLEEQLQIIVCTQQVRDNLRRLFSMMRQSILMKPSYGSESAINPKEFRLQTVKVLIRQLHLRRLPNPTIDIPLSNNGRIVQNFKQLIITLNLNRNSESGDWNQRQVRCQNFLDI